MQTPAVRVSPWTSDTVDEILIDAMYMKAFDDDTILESKTLSLTYLPDRVHWPTMTADPAKPNQYLPTASEKSNHMLAAVYNTVIVAKSHVFCSISHTILLNFKSLLS